MKKILFTVILIYLLIQFPNIFSKFTNDDEQLYAWLSFKYFQTPANIFLKESTDFWRPLIPLMTAPLILFFDPVTAIRIIALLISCAGIYAAYKLGKKIRDEKTGIFSSIFLAFSPIYFYFGAKGVLDPAISAISIIFTYFLLNYIEGKHIAPLIITAIIGAFTKQIAFAFFPLIVFAAIYKHKNKISPLIFGISAMALAAGLFLVQLYRPFSFNPLDNIFLISTILQKEILNVIFIPFFLIGLVAINLKKNEKSTFLIALYFLMPLLVFAPPDARLMAPAIPLIAIITAIGFTKIRLPSKKHELPALIAIALLISLIQLPLSYNFATDIYRTEPISNQLQEFAYAEVKPADLLILGAPTELVSREARLASDVALYNTGNKLLTIPEKKEEFESALQNSRNKTFLILIKKNEYTENLMKLEPQYKKNWIYKLKEEPPEYLNSLGFKKTKSFYKTKPLSDEKYEYLEVFELNK